MDEAKLQEIEARANETVLRCVKGGACDAPARWQKQTVRGIVRACYDHVGNRAGWRPIVAIELDVLDLADEFRRYDGEEDELLRQAATQAEHLQLDAEDRAKRAERARDAARAEVARLRAEHAAALAAARREGAEEVMAMSNPWPLHDVLAKLTEASRALLNRYNYDGHGWELILAACESADAIIARIHARTRALPLDAPGGGS